MDPKKSLSVPTRRSTRLAASQGTPLPQVTATAMQSAVSPDPPVDAGATPADLTAAFDSLSLGPEKPQAQGENVSPHEGVGPEVDGETVPKRVPTHIRFQNLGNARDTLREKLGPVPTVSVEKILSFFAERITAGDVARIKDELEAGGSITNGKWAAFQIDPAKSNIIEDRTFEPMAALFKLIWQKCVEVKPTLATAAFELCNTPSKAPLSERKNTSRPDGLLVLRDRPAAKLTGAPDDIRWEDAAAFFEYKKKNSEGDRIDNEGKVVWSAHRILRDDPCRRFVLGISIENTDTRLWYVNRSVLAVSQPFNFVTDHAILIRLFAIMAFSTPVEAGWDPTMRRCINNGKFYYEVDVYDCVTGKTRTYVTTEILADHGAETMQGRAPRVYEAFEKGDRSRKPVVVKDIWIEDDRQREGDILNTILSEASKQNSSAAATSAQYFPTIICHGDVMIDGRQDQTLHLGMRGNSIPTGTKLHPMSMSTYPVPKEGAEAQGYLPYFGPKSRGRVQHPKDKKYQDVIPRAHYRIAFNEVGIPLYEVHNLRMVYSVLGAVVKGLEVMHSVGYVHRDVSASNILLLPDGRGVLTDLEYAKHESTRSNHGVRSGSPHFTAVEVALQKYHFLRAIDQMEVDGDGGSGKRHPRPVFKYNRLHDFESVLWICLWELYIHAPLKSPSEHWEDFDPHEQLTAYDDMFPDTLVPSAQRLQALEGKNNHSEYLHSLLQPVHRKLLPAWVKLLKRYREAETAPFTGGPFPPMQGVEELYAAFSQALDGAKEVSPDMELITIERWSRMIVSDDSDEQ
ncbi:hypothetical protein BV25DRAFT_1920204 [Artomyces pyxidatus]|uniref:Uncharacterized protein n=1 Tax=Artomyces pyxidatus TaxID=48021 RepID=A0ACB8SN90_9AGAM|nr:hypothetical protein BV25DRAFT_1920204 [Artomyces pyxidatus]